MPAYLKNSKWKQNKLMQGSSLKPKSIYNLNEKHTERVLYCSYMLEVSKNHKSETHFIWIVLMSVNKIAINLFDKTITLSLQVGTIKRKKEVRMSWVCSSHTCLNI